MSNECGCGGVNLIYACSGGSDVGKIADEVARRLAENNCGKMTCLSAIGAHLSGFVECAKGAQKNISIDGCNIACARKTLEHTGIKPESYIITDMGFQKGKTPVSDKIVEEVVKKITNNPVDSYEIKTDNKQNICCC